MIIAVHCLLRRALKEMLFLGSTRHVLVGIFLLILCNSLCFLYSNQLIRRAIENCHILYLVLCHGHIIPLSFKHISAWTFHPLSKSLNHKLVNYHLQIVDNFCRRRWERTKGRKLMTHSHDAAPNPVWCSKYMTKKIWTMWIWSQLQR